MVNCILFIFRIIIIWKSILFNFRILFFSTKDFSFLCYFLNYLQEIANNHILYPLFCPMFLYYVGLLDVDLFRFINGWVGYTSDQAFLLKKEYDILINDDLTIIYSTKEIENTLKINKADKKRYNQLLEHIRHDKKTSNCFVHKKKSSIILPMYYIYVFIRLDLSKMLIENIAVYEEISNKILNYSPKDNVIDIKNKIYPEDIKYINKICKLLDYPLPKINNNKLCF